MGDNTPAVRSLTVSATVRKGIVLAIDTMLSVSDGLDC